MIYDNYEANFQPFYFYLPFNTLLYTRFDPPPGLPDTGHLGVPLTGSRLGANVVPDEWGSSRAQFAPYLVGAILFN